MDPDAIERSEMLKVLKFAANQLRLLEEDNMVDIFRAEAIHDKQHILPPPLPLSITKDYCNSSVTHKLLLLLLLLTFFAHHFLCDIFVWKKNVYFFQRTLFLLFVTQVSVNSFHLPFYCFVACPSHLPVSFVLILLYQAEFYSSRLIWVWHH